MRLIKIGAEWCGPCGVMDKRLENFNACDYVKYDVDNEDEETPDAIRLRKKILNEKERFRSNR